MRNVIQKVMASEEEARKILEKAKIEGDEIVAQSRIEAAHFTERAKKELREQAERIVTAATEEASEKTDRLVAEARSRVYCEINANDGVIENAAVAVAAAIRG